MHLNLCFEIKSVYSTKNISTKHFPTFHFSCRNNNVIVTAFLISFILSGDTYACFLLPIIRYCLDTHGTISTFKFYSKIKKKNHIRIFEGTLCNLKKKKWLEPQYLANPPNLILSGVTHSLKNFLIFLISFPKFSEWHHIYTQIDKAR